MEARTKEPDGAKPFPAQLIRPRVRTTFYLLLSVYGGTPHLEGILLPGREMRWREYYDTVAHYGVLLEASMLTGVAGPGHAPPGRSVYRMASGSRHSLSLTSKDFDQNRMGQLSLTVPCMPVSATIASAQFPRPCPLFSYEDNGRMRALDNPSPDTSLVRPDRTVETTWSAMLTDAELTQRRWPDAVRLD